MSNPPSLDDRIEFHRSDEWTAVYLNGRLQRVGDHYLADEWLQTHYGVKVIEDDAFMQGGNGRSSVANYLGEVVAYMNQRQERLKRAYQLREQAAELVRQADELAKGKADELAKGKLND